MRTISYTVLMLFLFLSANCLAQGYVKSDYLFSSTFRNDVGDKLGSGDLWKISGRYTLPFSMKRNNDGQITAWSATISGSYGILHNKNMVNNIHPDEILNTNLSIAHVRPLSAKWSLIASLGGGIYAEPNAITAKCILASGGAIFVYKVSNRLNVGVGLGLTNSYGVPIVMPMAYLKWDLPGKYEIKVDLSTQVEISAATKLTDRLKLRLVGIEMDGMSAVREVEGESMIYSTTMMRSYLTSELKVGKSSTLFLGGGGVWTRSAKLSKRSLKSFWNSFKDDDDKLRFNPTGYLTVGFRYGF